MALTEDQKKRLMGNPNFIKTMAGSSPTTGTTKLSPEELSKQMIAKYVTPMAETAPAPTKATPKKKGFLESFTEGMAEGAESITTAGGLTKKIPYLGKAWEVASGAVVPTTLTKSASKVTKGESLTPGEILFSTLEALPGIGQGVKTGSKLAKTAAKEYLPSVANIVGDVASKTKSITNKLTPKPLAMMSGEPEIAKMTGKEIKANRLLVETPEMVIEEGKKISSGVKKLNEAAKKGYESTGELLKSIKTDAKTAVREVNTNLLDALKGEKATIKNGKVVLSSKGYADLPEVNTLLNKVYSKMKLSGTETAEQIRENLKGINAVIKKIKDTKVGTEAAPVINKMKQSFKDSISKLPGGKEIIAGQEEYSNLRKIALDVEKQISKSGTVDSKKVFDFLKRAAKPIGVDDKSRIELLQQTANKYGVNIDNVTDIISRMTKGLAVSAKEAPLAQNILAEIRHLPVVKSVFNPRFMGLIKQIPSDMKIGGLAPKEFYTKQLLSNLLGTGYEQLTKE